MMDGLWEDCFVKVAGIDYMVIIVEKYFKDVSREFNEFRVNTHLCKLCCWYL